MSQLEFACALARRRLQERLDGALGERERLELDAHLAACAECRAAADGLLSLVSGLGGLPELELAERDLEVVWARTVDARPSRRPRRRLLALLAAAALLAVGLWSAERGVGDEDGDGGAGAPTPAELAQAKADLELVTQLTQRALRASQRGAVETALDHAVYPALQRIPVVRRN
jgi:anti-sigma factor RsiW